MMGWRDVHAQHDAGEFMCLILLRVSWMKKDMVWSSRVQGAEDTLATFA